ncbi:GPR1/FUN34/yaaH family-domain-containing protein [Absidia repens]|uniref:GPR1/FUN34/yaaH family-domain-containing protein n=1 Tax=Absidia repens TaxID=90262 RepID=A0A1X2ITC4_9FUNG|nr:GPR1/FUN34/yaaH family-domain-containing protein [Absidia repens]
MSEGHDLESKYQVAPPAPPPVAPVVIANPAPLGLSAFALTTFVLSLHNAGAGLAPTSPHGVVTGLAFFYGGLCQLLAGMWEFRTGNTFGATAFTSYAGFWMSFGLIFVPGADIIGSYKGDTATLNKSLGFYLLGWTIFTGVMLIATHRSSVSLISLFFMLFITFILLTAAKFNGSIVTQQAGGALGVVTAFIAWYNALAGLLTKQSSHFTLPTGPLN